MSLFNQLINGKGHPKLIWEVTLNNGNDANTLSYWKTYSEALAEKVNNPKRKHIVIELYFRDIDTPKHQPEYIGDDSNFLVLQDRILTF